MTYQVKFSREAEEALERLIDCALAREFHRAQREDTGTLTSSHKVDA